MHFRKALAFTLSLSCIVPTSVMIMNNESSIVSTYAYDTFQDFTYSKIGSSGNVTILSYTGTDTNVVIPSTITDEFGQTYTVTELQDGIFKDNVKIKSVTLPNTITSIAYTFKGCTALETVIFEDNSTLETISNHAFDGCTSLTTINLPKTLKDINIMAFYNCKSLKSIDLPANLKTIGQEAFTNSGLTSLMLPDKLSTVGGSAFQNCTSLKTLTIEDGSKVRLYTSCFEGCSALETVDLGTTIEELPNSVFKGCSSLTTIDIPKYIDVIPESAFQDCTSLTTVNFSDEVVDIWKYAFYNCTSLKDVSLPPDISRICAFAFANCDSLTHIDIPTTVSGIFIRTGAFAGCNSMYYITIPQGNPDVSFESYALGYDYSKIQDDELINPTLMENFTIVGVVGSDTQTYAIENNIPFIDIETGELPEIPDNPTPTKNNFVNGVFCDVNGDGVANIIDLLIVKKTILGM